jgi:hydrogenase maturation protease
MMPANTVVIGCGNPLMGDDGVGLAALARLQRDWDFAPAPEFVDGGTWGMNLLPVIESADRVVLLDAIDVGAEPGTVVVLERAELPKLLEIKVSPHQIGLREVLALAELRGSLPADTMAIGLQPDVVALGTELSRVCGAQMDLLVARVVRQMDAWGFLAWPAAPCVQAHYLQVGKENVPYA